MADNTVKFLTKGIWVAIAFFVIRCIISMPESAYDIFGFAGEAISVTTILMGVYNSILWKYNPLEKLPRLKGRYEGKIEYSFTGKEEIKHIEVIIKQTLLSVKVKITTDEITSNTIVSNLVDENGEYILYYTYITNPKSKFRNENPIQYGTCRLTIKSMTELKGVYWTSRQTIGDMNLTMKERKGEY